VEKVMAREKPTVLAFYDGLAGGAILIIISLALILTLAYTLFWWFPFLGLAVGALLISLAFLNAWANTYLITDRGVRREYRLIAVEVSEIPYDRATNVVVLQDIVGRVFRFGTVRVDSAGTPFKGVVFRGVRRPEEIRRLILEQMAKKA
jgi:uncharacterized membrane protein YdbT with pleckstrin-like domain